MHHMGSTFLTHAHQAASVPEEFLARTPLGGTCHLRQLAYTPWLAHAHLTYHFANQPLLQPDAARSPPHHITPRPLPSTLQTHIRTYEAANPLSQARCALRPLLPVLPTYTNNPAHLRSTGCAVRCCRCCVPC